ncbi:MAG: hypothetical protein E6713_07715 [Sporomusaceae bacterium]|nr:hypothetical protein [Sporomusaceae bacterium]
MILNSAVPTTGKSICATAANSSYAVTAAFFCNTAPGSTEILNLYLVSKNGGVGSQSLIINNLEIKAADTFVLDTEKIILENGDYLYATSSNGNISATLSVMDIT